MNLWWLRHFRNVKARKAVDSDRRKYFDFVSVFAACYVLALSSPSTLWMDPLGMKQRVNTSNGLRSHLGDCTDLFCSTPVALLL